MSNENVYIKVDTSEVEIYLNDIGHENQLPYALSKAINSVLKIIQDAVRNDMKSKIALRRVAFNLNAIKVFPGDWATKQKLLGILSIDPRAANLFRLETGSDHIPINGKKYLPLPNPTVFGSRVIMKDNPLSLSSLKLHDTPQGTRGSQGTFLIESEGTPLILQRMKKPGSKGRGKKGTDKATGNRLLYTLVKRTTTPKKIDFRAIAIRIVNQHFREEIIKAINQAIKTARKK